MKKVTCTLAVLSFMVASVLLLTPSGIFAQAQDNPEERITLSPAVLRPEFDANQNATGKLTVINDGTTSYTFLVYARPFSVNGEQYDPNYTEINQRTEAYQWVQFKKTEYKLQPGERVEVEYSIRVPNRAGSGGHYAVIFAETQPPAGGANVVRKKRVGSLFYMTVSGSINRSGSLQSWDVPFWQKKRPLTSYARLKNDGNVHYQADLNASYKNIFGKTQFQLNQQLLILPGTTRRIPVQWNDAPTLGIFKAGGKVSFLGKTENLPNHYILLLPAIVPIVALALLILIIAGSVLRKRSKRSTFSGRKRR